LIVGGSSDTLSTNSTGSSSKAMAHVPADTTIHSRSHRRIVQNFLLIMLHANIDESKQDFQNSMANLRHIVASTNLFIDADECIDSPLGYILRQHRFSV
jgi:hypothetical protein